MTDNNTQPYSAAHFVLVLDDNAYGGMFRSVEGGGIKTDVMTYQHGATYERWRQLGKPKFEDIKVQAGMSMSAPFYQWISSFFTGNVVRKTGAIIAGDFFYKQRAVRSFSEALISELTFPKLDGADNNPVFMGIGLAVENIVYTKGDLSSIMHPEGTNAGNALNWTAANFHLKLDAFDDAVFDRVTKVDSFTIKQNIIEYHSGNQRAPIKCASQIEFPPISFYLPEVDAQPLFDHVKKRIVGGEVPGRINGQLQMLDNSLTPIFTLQFMNCDITSVAPDKSDASATAIKQVKVDFYTESMTFKWEASGTGDGQ